MSSPSFTVPPNDGQGRCQTAASRRASAAAAGHIRSGHYHRPIGEDDVRRDEAVDGQATRAPAS
jgi:hypothetical protein